MKKQPKQNSLMTHLWNQFSVHFHVQCAHCSPVISVLLCCTGLDSEVYVATQVSSLMMRFSGRYTWFSSIKNLPSFLTELMLEEKFKAGSQWRVGAFILYVDLQTAILWLFSLYSQVETLVTKTKINFQLIYQYDISIIWFHC